MPKFTIFQAGRKIDEISASGDRIEVGSARSCAVFIDDLLISLKQAALVRGKAGEPYQIEPLSRLPVLKLDGVAVDGPLSVRDGAGIAIEGYEIRVQYLPGELLEAAASPPETRPLPPEREEHLEQPLPPSLEPDLPPPLDTEDSRPSAGVPTGTVPPIRPEARSAAGDQEKTVFVRRAGRLVAISGPLKGQHWDLIIGETRIGRDPAQNHVVIRLDAQGQVDSSISRRHASVHVVGEQVFVEDQSSAAGTFVAGRQVPPGQRVRVNDQDVIEIRSAKESTLLRLELLRAGQPPPRVVPPEPIATPVREAPAAAPPRHDDVLPRDDSEGDDAAPRRRRRAARADYDENPFVPMEDKQGRRALPRWVWMVVAAAAVLILGVLVIFALG